MTRSRILAAVCVFAAVGAAGCTLTIETHDNALRAWAWEDFEWEQKVHVTLCDLVEAAAISSELCPDDPTEPTGGPPEPPDIE